MTDDKITTLPVKPKAETGHLMLVPPPAGCSHYPAKFQVDVDGGRCKCRTCGGEVSPFFVLKMLMQKESQWNRTREAYGDEMKRLGERSKTKCEHCKKLTRISRR